MTPRSVAEGYALLMSRYSMPVFLTQTFARLSHPEAVGKAHRYTVQLLNAELHGKNWKRKGVTGAQSVLGIERHKSGFPHSHAVIGHPDLDLGAPEYSALRRSLRLTCEAEWGFAKLEVAKSAEHCCAYVAKYVAKDGEITISDRLEALSTGRLSTAAALPFGPHCGCSRAAPAARQQPRSGPQGERWTTTTSQASWAFVAAEA